MSAQRERRAGVEERCSGGAGWRLGGDVVEREAEAIRGLPAPATAVAPLRGFGAEVFFGSFGWAEPVTTRRGRGRCGTRRPPNWGGWRFRANMRGALIDLEMSSSKLQERCLRVALR